MAPLIAFLYPGQGSQQPGMGTELLQDEEVSALCDRCESAAGVDLRRLLTTDSDDELRLTQNAQPALCFVGIALTLLLRRRGIEPAGAAGHSVGEYAALCIAGAVEPEQAVKAVVERGKAMAEAAPPGTSSMLAVLGIGPDAVASALEAVLTAEPELGGAPTLLLFRKN